MGKRFTHKEIRITHLIFQKALKSFSMPFLIPDFIIKRIISPNHFHKQIKATRPKQSINHLKQQLIEHKKLTTYDKRTRIHTS